jgi:hypothetical protein
MTKGRVALLFSVRAVMAYGVLTVMTTSLTLFIPHHLAAFKLRCSECAKNQRLLRFSSSAKQACDALRLSSGRDLIKQLHDFCRLLPAQFLPIPDSHLACSVGQECPLRIWPKMPKITPVCRKYRSLCSITPFLSSSLVILRRPSFVSTAILKGIE